MTGASTYPGAANDRVWRSLVFPESYVNPRAQAKYHLVVVGAGPAGLVCALGAAGLGARVALVERQAMGGDCLNTGCVPSKALLEYVRTHSGGASFDAAFARMRAVRARIAAHDSVQRVRDNGIDVFLGAARFVDGRTVEVGEQRLRGRRIVLATGGRAALPDIPGLRSAEPLTSDSVFALERAPESLAIIGAGSVGCELAQAMARLGVAIHLLEVAGRVLPAEEPEASAAVMSALRRDGVELHLGARVSSIERIGEQTRVALDGTELRASRVLVAAGRQANLEDLDLGAAGIEVTARGFVEVDARLRTTNPRVYAAGDVCSRRQFTHHADAQARIVIQNALFAPTARADRLVVPRCTYTMPEVGQVGRTKAALEADATPFRRYAMDFADLDRGRVAGDGTGFAELLIEPKRSELLGATIVANDAGELIVPVCVAMSNGLKLGALGNTVYPYPTRSEYLRHLADAHNRARLTPAIETLAHAWLRLIG